MARKRTQPSASQNGRLLWTATGTRLWDRGGSEWEPMDGELTRRETEAMVRDPNVPVAISVGARPLRWLDGNDRITVWQREIAPNFHDTPDWNPPPGAPGQNPYHALAWRRGDRRLLLITDFD